MADRRKTGEGAMKGWKTRRAREAEKTSFAMDRHVEALARIEMLESIVRRVPSYPVMLVRYRRGEKSWAPSILKRFAWLGRCQETAI